MRKSILILALACVFALSLRQSTTAAIENSLSRVPSLAQSANNFRVYLPLVVGGTGVSNAGTNPTEWSQLAHDSQRTSFTIEDPGSSANWQYAWHWQPSDMTTMPRGAQAITGGGLVYMPGGAQGLYAIRQSDGVQAWNKPGTFNAAAAYGSDGYLYVGGADGNLYKLNPTNGTTVAMYNTASSINHAVLLVSAAAYVTTDDGKLHRVNTATMTRTWVYTAPNNSPATTPASYSSSKDLIVFGTKDLYVHAVVNASGLQQWNVKPTSLPAGDCYPYSYEYGWPVIADSANVVLMRMRLGKNDSWLWGPGTSNRYPTTNADIKTLIDSDPNKKALFALNLDTGASLFTPAVGNGGVDDYFSNCNWGTNTTSTIGSMPVVKTINGKQVAYIQWKNGDVANASWDGRWDSHMGEMVLDNATVPGYNAGDVRFVYWDGGGLQDGMIADEITPLTVAGNTIFQAHWGASESRVITNRANNLGATRANPITTSANPSVIRRENPTGTMNATTHWLTANPLYLYGDSRTWAGPGWWVFWNAWDPPTPSVNSCYTDGMRPRYTFVSNGLIYIVGNGGDIFALKYK